MLSYSKTIAMLALVLSQAACVSYGSRDKKQEGSSLPLIALASCQNRSVAEEPNSESCTEYHNINTDELQLKQNCETKDATMTEGQYVSGKGCAVEVGMEGCRISIDNGYILVWSIGEYWRNYNCLTFKSSESGKRTEAVVMRQNQVIEVIPMKAQISSCYYDTPASKAKKMETCVDYRGSVFGPAKLKEFCESTGDYQEIPGRFVEGRLCENVPIGTQGCKVSLAGGSMTTWYLGSFYKGLDSHLCSEEAEKVVR